MCKVFEEIRAEGRTEGRLEGRLEGRTETIENGAKGIIRMGKKFGISNENILNSLQEDLGISFEEAKKYLDKFSK